MRFHVARNGAVIGDFAEQTFRNKVFAGEITPNDLYWREGFRDWRSVSEFRVARKTDVIVLEARTGTPPAIHKRGVGIKVAGVIAGIVVLALIIIAFVTVTR